MRYTQGPSFWNTAAATFMGTLLALLVFAAIAYTYIDYKAYTVMQAIRKAK